MNSRLGKISKIDQIQEAVLANFKGINELVKELDYEKRITETTANIKDSYGRGFLDDAVVEGRTKVHKYLLKELKLHVDETYGEDFTHPLLASLKGHLCTVGYRNKSGADPAASNKHSKCALSTTTKGNTIVEQSVLSKGRDVNDSSGTGTPIQLAAKFCKKNVQVLLEHGGNAPDLNVENKEEFPDFSERFTTDQIFESRQDLLDWVHGTGRSCSTSVTIKRSEKKTGRPRIVLCCQHYNKREGFARKVCGKRKEEACPFQLRGVHVPHSNDKWKLSVHCGRHNHQVVSPIESASYVDPLKLDEIGLFKELTKSGMRPEHALKEKDLNLTKKVKLMHTRRTTRSTLSEISIDRFWEVTRPFIDDVHNVASDGHCGFRAVAAGLGVDSLYGWATVREELILELETFKDEYQKIYGDEKDIKQIRNALDCTISPCPQKYWFTLPTMGHLVASRYKVVFVCISNEDAVTFVPLTSPPSNNELRVMAIGHVDRVHYVSIKLKPGCPIPLPMKVWANCKLSERWGNLLKNRSDEFTTIVGHQPSKEAASSEAEPILIN